MKAELIKRVLLHLAFLAVVLGLWEYGAMAQWLSPTFFGRPSGIATYLWDNLVVSHDIWVELGWTLAGTFISFALGSVLAVAVGLSFVVWPLLERFLEPYFTALNVMPRIALVPLFILWFGLGLGSKIAVGVSLVFFIVLSNTVAGIRGVSQDLIILSRTLGATPSQLFFLVTMPGAVPVIFSGLRLGLIFAMLGVVGAEIVASEHGLGQRLAYLGATFDINGVMALLLVLSVLGVVITNGMTWIERRLLTWQ